MRRLALAAIACVALTGCAAAPSAPQGDGGPLPTRSRADRNQDDGISITVASRLRALDAGAYRAVSVKAVAGRVLLTGAVVKPDQRRQALQTAAAVEGVTQVIDHIQMTEDGTLTQYMPDGRRELALRSKLADTPPISYTNYDVRVVNGVVYLLGNAGSAEEVEQVKAVLAEDPEVKWVVSAVKIR